MKIDTRVKTHIKGFDELILGGFPKNSNILISGTYINSRVLRMEPALTISYPELDKFLVALEESLVAVCKEFKI